MEKVNPVVYWLKLLGGIFSILLSIMLWVQMYFPSYLVCSRSLFFPQVKVMEASFLTNFSFT